MKKFIFLAGLGIGFVIGSRAGRGPYESLERTAQQITGGEAVDTTTGEVIEEAELPEEPS